jgi:hypothetical protein
MRVSQIQNLTWAGNVLLLGGLVWVGFQFWEARKQKTAKEWKWESQKVSTDGPRWPGDLAAFTHIWQTPINGKVPPPPVKPSEVVAKVDKVQEFKNKLKYYGGMEFPGQPELSTARVNFEGKDWSICPGGTLGGFQLVEFTLDDAKKLARLVFRDPATGSNFTVEQPPSLVPPISDPNVPLFKKRFGNAVQEGAVPENGPLDATAFPDPKTGEIVIPEEEQAWLELYGQKNIWANLDTKPDVDAQGVSHGVKIMKSPEVAPLTPTHDVGVGDVVRSINGVPMTSKEDILNYLRGAGKGQTLYKVEIENAGKVRTVVYRLSRRR